LLLASALLMNNRPQDALDEIARAEVSGWRSAPLYALKAEAAALAGRPDEAEVARAEAVRINPQIFHPRTPLIWFSHG
jgi:predicted Zn-dependent protease